MCVFLFFVTADDVERHEASEFRSPRAAVEAAASTCAYKRQRLVPILPHKPSSPSHILISTISNAFFLLPTLPAGYTCSCSPFDCVCGTLPRAYPSQPTYQTASSNHHHQPQPHHPDLSISNPSNPMYNPHAQQMTGTEAPAYWPQEPAMEQTSLGYPCLPQEASSYPTTTEFPAGFGNDLFQPEEIFQLDQPIRSDFAVSGGGNGNEVARSPPSLLDLGSGTIKYEMPDMHEQSYWTQLLSEDSSSSHVSVSQVRFYMMEKKR